MASTARFDVVAIGNAIVDVLARADDALIEAEGLTKGSMRLIDAGEAERLYAAMGPAVEVSGGSAANTARGHGGARRTLRLHRPGRRTTSSATFLPTTCAHWASPMRPRR